jgi:hypothetical protein
VTPAAKRKPRTLAYLTGSVVAVAAVAGGVWFVRPTPGPLDTVPTGTLVVADIDFAGLRASPLWNTAREAIATRVPIDKLDAACGFATLSRLERGVLSIGEGETGGVGVALAGSIAKEELLHCQTQIVIGAAGVTKNQFSAASSHGSFLLTPLRLADVDLVLGMGLRRPLLIATPTWIEGMANAADEPDKASFTRLFGSALRLPDPHRGVRERLEKAAGVPLLFAASAKMPSGQANLVRTLGQFLPTSELAKRAQDIDGLRAAGLSISTSNEGKRTAIRVVIDAGSEGSAAAVRDVLLGARLVAGQNMMVRIAGVGKLLDGLTVTVEGTWVQAKIEDTTDVILDNVTKLRAMVGA